ncbi:hypothetical protein M758_2G060700 [Ceratodon purpureus]|nr:hypothetical protein M758_2G060700 [Ceratodon purpureus]
MPECLLNQRKETSSKVSHRKPLHYKIEGTCSPSYRRRTRLQRPLAKNESYPQFDTHMPFEQLQGIPMKHTPLGSHRFPAGNYPTEAFACGIAAIFKRPNVMLLEISSWR